MSPTARSLKVLRDDGWTADVVERFNSFTKQRHDLFGFADIIAIHPQWGTMLVQATSTSNQAARVTKIMGEPRHKLWLLSGRGHHYLQVHGWGKRKVKRGGKAVRWELTRTPIFLESER